jgi:putative redox protein
MSTTTVRWVCGKQFVGIDSTKHSIVMSSADEGVGVKPSDMLLLGIAACSAVDLVEILNKKRMPPVSLEIISTGEQDSEPPWTFRKIHIKYVLSGEKLTEKAVSQAISLAEEKYCSVAATVRGVAEIITDFEILSRAE